MDAASLAPALAALAGGVVGVAGTATVTWMSHRAARADRRREDVQELAGELLATCDEMWRQDQAVHVAVLSLMNVQRRTDEGRAAELEHHDAQRREAIAAFNSARTRAGDILGTLSLICPELDEPAERYVEASSYSQTGDNTLPTKEQKAAKEAARADFVAAARAALKD